MSVVVEEIYERGIVKLKTEVIAPNNTEVLVVFKDKANKKKFLKSAGSWKNVDPAIFNEIFKSRENLRERTFEF